MIKEFNDQAAVMRATGPPPLMMQPPPINYSNLLGKTNTNMSQALDCKSEKMNMMQQPVYMPMMPMQTLPMHMIPMNPMNNIYNNHINNFGMTVKNEQPKKLEIQSATGIHSTGIHSIEIPKNKSTN